MNHFRRDLYFRDAIIKIHLIYFKFHNLHDIHLLEFNSKHDHEENLILSQFYIKK